MNPNLMSRFVVTAIAAAAFCALVTRPSQAQIVREKNVFVWIAGFDLQPSQQSARMFHEDSPTHLASL